jgi:hypothetical protein
MNENILYALDISLCDLASESLSVGVVDCFHDAIESYLRKGTTTNKV